MDPRAIHRRGPRPLRGVSFATKSTGRPSRLGTPDRRTEPRRKGKAPNITAAGLAKWSKEDIAEALFSGFTPTGDSLGSAMAAVVRNTAECRPNIAKGSPNT
jgi:hypothetical protein